MSKRFDNKVVWITGGGSGIGREMAMEFARRGAIVAISGRRLDRLEDTASSIRELGTKALAVQCDVTDERAVEAAVAAVAAEFGQLDVAVANAGYGVSGPIEDLSADDWRRQFDVNVVGLAMTVKYAMPHLRESRGRVALIGSVAGEIASPGSGAYSASKYAVRAIGQVLSMELAGKGVTCTLVQPGFVESEIALVDNSGNFREEWTDKRPQALLWPTDKAARTIVDAIYKRKRDFTFTAHGKVAGFLGRHAPGFVHFAITSSKKKS